MVVLGVVTEEGLIITVSLVVVVVVVAMTTANLVGIGSRHATSYTHRGEFQFIHSS